MIRLHPATADAMAEGLSAAIDAADRPGTVSFYSGTMPSSITARAPENILARLEFAKPAFAPAKEGKIVAWPIKSGTAASTGRATWARVADGAGRTIFDCDVGAGDGALIQMNSAQFAQGGPVTLESFTLTMRQS